MRFCKRHSLVSRVANTKMRVPGADLDAKVATYMSVLGKEIFQYQVVRGMVVSTDESNAHFAPRATKTLAVRGAKRVRVVGVGAEKPQITVTYMAFEDGEMGPPQLIFAGKTPRCLETVGVRPAGWHITYSPTHWQGNDVGQLTCGGSIGCGGCGGSGGCCFGGIGFGGECGRRRGSGFCNLESICLFLSPKYF